MALSNIFREPRREITESVIGVSMFIIVLGGLYLLGLVVRSIEPNMSIAKAILVGFFSTMLGVWILTVLALLTHAIGEGVCSLLAKRGWDPRPDRRARR